VDRVLYAGKHPDGGAAVLAGLARALHEAAPDRPVRVDVLTEDLREVAGSPVRAPQRAALDGAATVLVRRYPTLRFHVVDLPSTGTSGSEADRRRRRDLVLAELATDPGGEQVAYRGARRFRRSLVAVPPGRVESAGVVPDAGYLVVGAAEPGLRIAGELARAGARVLLAGEAEVVDLVDPDDTHPLERLLAAYPDTVHWLPTDPTDPDGAHRLVSAARDRLGRLRGVVHAVDLPPAGGPERAPQAPGTPQQAASTTGGPEEDLREVGRQFDRIRLLAGLLDGDDLDFLLLATGGRGGADPLAEEALAAVLGAYAEERTAEGRPTGAVRLRPVDGADADHRTALGTAAVWAALASGAPQVRVVAEEVPADSPVHPDGTAPPPGVSEPVGGRRLEDDIERTVAEVWQEVLGVSDFGPDDDFYQLGGNSLFAMQIIARLRQHFGDLPMSVIFESPTVTSLAAAIRVWQGEGIGLDEFEALLAEIEATPAVGGVGGGDHV
jgi:acyl carrier protein